MELLFDRYKDKIAGILNCYDRIVVTGTLPVLCYSQGMSSYLYQKGIRIFDYPKFAEPYKLSIRENAEKLAKEHQIEIEFIKSCKARKEDIVKKKFDGKKTGLIHILSAMEGCSTYKPWYDKKTGKTYLKGDMSKCLHYYFYFNDSQLGLGYVRVPTWCPFRLQIYFNGHSLLSCQLKKEGIGYSMLDNAFDYMEDFEKAQEISDNLSIESLHQKLNELALIYCPVHKEFDQVYHWSVMQAEYATDIVFKKQQDLQNIYGNLISTAIHTVKPDNIATFLGQKLHGNYEGEMGNNYNVRIEGSRIKHNMGEVSIKMYDKFSKILRIETTVNNISFFKHYRTVEHRDGTSTQKQAPLKKNIYSLAVLQDILKGSNKRYIEFISAIEDKKLGKENLEKITTPKIEKNRKYKGFNFFDKADLEILQQIARGEFNISGFRSKNLKKYLKDKTSSQLSRILKRLHLLGLIKKVRNTYKYYLTELAKTSILTALKIKEMIIIPQLNYIKTN